jgi:hypothetical protein
LRKPPSPQQLVAPRASFSVKVSPPGAGPQTLCQPVRTPSPSKPSSSSQRAPASSSATASRPALQASPVLGSSPVVVVVSSLSAVVEPVGSGSVSLVTVWIGPVSGPLLGSSMVVSAPPLLLLLPSVSVVEVPPDGTQAASAADTIPTATLVFMMARDFSEADRARQRNRRGAERLAVSRDRW